MFPSRSRAAASVLAGEVLLCPSAAGPASRASSSPTTSRSRSRSVPQFVSRGGVKLANALDALGLDVAGAAARSTSAPRPAASPTACSSAAPQHVIALDVAYGELDWRLRSDPRVTVIERRNARALHRRQLPVPARPDRDRRLVHLAGQGAAGGARVRGRRGSTAWRWSSPSSRSGASASARAAWCATPRAAARGADRGRRGCGRRSARPCSATRARGCRGRRATSRRSSGSPRPAARRGSPDIGPPRRRGGAMTAMPRRATVITHRRPAETGAGARSSCSSSRARPASKLRFDRRRRASTSSARRRAGARRRRSSATSTSASRSAATGRSSPRCARYAGTERARVRRSTSARSGSSRRSTATRREPGFEPRVRGRLRGARRCPAIEVSGRAGRWLAINDVSMHRQPGKRVADLSTRSAATRSGGSAATAWWSRLRPARPATTSPTAVR